ncbi:MAG: LTA synthase family protein [Candidatus Saccharicenans sp.]
MAKSSPNYSYVQQGYHLPSIFLEKVPLRFTASVMSLSLFLIAEVLFLKNFMLKDSGSYSAFVDVFRVSGNDVVFILIPSILLIIISTVFNKSPYAVLKMAYVLFAFIYSISMIAQAILFKTTGLGLTREYIQNFFHNPGQDLKMILVEVKTAHWLGLILILILLLCLARLPDINWFNRIFIEKIFKGNSKSARHLVLTMILVILITLEGLALLPKLESVHPAIKQISFIEFLQGLWPERAKEELIAVEILPEERLDKPVMLEPGPAFRRHNVVLIIFESLSWKYCDIYKPGLGATPFMAELARKGVVIERLYTVDPHTTKALIPIIGGIYPFPDPGVLEAKPGILPEKALPHLLKKFGYRTAFFQTANNYEDRPSVVSNLGYECFRGLYHMPQEGYAYVNYFGREEMMMLRPSLEWVDSLQGQPFFLTYLTLSTHHEYGFPNNFPARDFKVQNENQNRYLNAVRYTDFFIRKLFEEYEKRNLLNKTIFIIVGDHGEAFGEHDLTGHNYTLWEEGLRVPGIIYAPGIFNKPGLVEGFRSALDLVPTVCDLLGLRVREGKFIGRSLLSPADEDRELFYTGWSKSRVIAYRRGRYKFIYPIWSPKPEIYDNLVDVNDENNIFNLKSDVAAEAEVYKEKAKRWFEVVAAQYRQWDKESQPECKLNRPEEFARRIEAKIDNLITIYGHGYFPERTEPGRTVYVRIGLRCDGMVKRPLALKAVLIHEKKGLEHTSNLEFRLPLENLKPGEYSSAETIISIPPDWPTGLCRLYVGVLDEKRETFIKPEGNDLETRDNGLIYIGDLSLFSIED